MLKTSDKAGPDFLVIGAQKSATTWLYSCLCKHPGLYLPPKKEIHYFDRSSEYSSSSLLSEASPVKRYDLKTAWNSLRKCIKKSNNKNEFLWYLHYFFSYCDDAWYRSLFSRKQSHQIAGEVTPGYSMLSKHDVARVKHINPHLKIIFIMRNPVDRDWSAFLMRLRKHKLRYKDVNDDYVYSFFNGDGCSRKGDYLTTLLNWQSQFPPEQIWLGYYEDVQKDPIGFLKRVFDYLGVGAPNSWSVFPLNKKMNVGDKRPIPERFKKFLSQKYVNDLMKIWEKTQNPHVKNWHDEALKWCDTADFN